jgi:CrcB protein
MLRAAAVGAAGALGAVSRYWIGLAIGTRAFPWATLSINVAGSFALGVVLAGPALTRWSTTMTTAVAVGFLGAFTTFSTFAFETTVMMRENRTAASATYVAASVALGLAASAGGYLLGRGSG